MNASEATGVSRRVEYSRRQFFGVTCGTVAVAALARLDTQGGDSRSVRLIDTNISLGQWPFRRCPYDEPSALVAMLKNRGVTEAWAGSFDALLHKDIAAANTRLAHDCRRFGRNFLVPFGTVNLSLPDWEDDFRRCSDQLQMHGIRLFPNYHSYALSDAVFRRFFEIASAHHLLIQITCSIEDERTQHPRLQTAPVDLAPLIDLMRKMPRARVQVLNGLRNWRSKTVFDLASLGVHFEIATLEGLEGIANVLRQLPATRLCFGSHAPFYYFESAKLKLQESVLTEDELQAICAGNARRIL